VRPACTSAEGWVITRNRVITQPQVLAPWPLSGNPGDELQFGGPDLAELYVTSAAYRLSTGQLKKEPHAGATLVCRPGAAAMPASSFAG
jgi:hypothetical protein